MKGTDIKKNLNLGLLIEQFCNSGIYGRKYGHVRCSVIKVEEDEKIKNINSMNMIGVKHNQYYDKLIIDCQTDNEADHTYGWNIEYYNPLYVKYEEAYKMYRTLNYIHNKLAKMEEEIGKPANYAQFVLRVAKILKIDWFVFNESEFPVSDYRNMKLHFVSDRGVANLNIRSMENSIIEKTNETAV